MAILDVHRFRASIPNPDYTVSPQSVPPRNLTLSENLTLFLNFLFTQSITGFYEILHFGVMN